MKKIYLSIVLLCSANLVNAQWGHRDSTFGTNGIVTSDIGINDVVYTVLQQPDGKILAGGSTGDNGQEDFALFRYLENGSPDSSFGSNGKTSLSINIGTDVGRGTLLQSDGKIVVSGYTQVQGQSAYDFVVARFKADGTVDSSYGTNGITTTPIGTGGDYSFCAGIQADDKVVIGGYIGSPDGGDFALVRYTTSGEPDVTFNGTGIATTDITGNADMGLGLTIQPDGKIILAGYVGDGTGTYDFGMARYNSDGTLDNTFGTMGKVITPMDTTENVCTGVAVQPDGKIVLSGYAWNANLTKTRFAMARYSSAGVLDNTFGTGGKVFTAVDTAHNFARAVMIQPDGKIVVAGQTSNPTTMHFSIVRFNTDGSPDNTFGINGKVFTPLSVNFDAAFAVSMQSDGKILVGGQANENFNMNALVMRYISGITLGVVNFSKEPNRLQVYPNPVEAFTTLEYTLTEKEDISIYMTDVRGRTVSSMVSNQVKEAGSYKESLTIPLTLPSGNYFIILASPKGQVAVQITK